MSTEVPSLTRSVIPDSHASVVNGSQNGAGYCSATSGVTTTWSETINRS
jgi:hypothetical protein